MLIIKKEKGNISGVHKMKFDLLPVIARSVRFLKKSGAASYSGAFNNAGFFFCFEKLFLGYNSVTEDTHKQNKIDCWLSDFFY